MKKIICILVVLSLFGLTSVFATDTTMEKFQSDTVITESNLNDVLISLGYDPRICIGDRVNAKMDIKITVGELRDMITKAEKKPKSIVIEVNNIGSVIEESIITIVDKTKSTTDYIGERLLTNTWNFSPSTDIKHSVYGEYLVEPGSEEWIGSEHPRVWLEHINTLILPITGYDLIYVSWCDTWNTSTHVYVDSQIAIWNYVIILGLKIYLGNKQHVTSYLNWGTNWI